MIIYQNTKITSTKKIANIANQFFMDKILKLRSKFTTPSFSASNFLNFLIDRNSNKWCLRPVTIEQMLEIICKAKGTNSTDFDSISMRRLEES